MVEVNAVTNGHESNVSLSPKLLPIRPPVRFDEALGIQHSSRWLGLYWEPELEQVCYTDGDTVSTGNAQSWRLFCAHAQIEPVLAPYQLGNDGATAQHMLLLDRDSSQLYIGESSVIEDCLRHPESLNLLASLDDSQTQSWPQFSRHLQPFQRSFSRLGKDKKLLFFIGVPAIAIAIYLLYEVADFVFDLLEFWDD